MLGAEPVFMMRILRVFDALHLSMQTYMLLKIFWQTCWSPYKHTQGIQCQHQGLHCPLELISGKHILTECLKSLSFIIEWSQRCVTESEILCFSTSCFCNTKCEKHKVSVGFFFVFFFTLVSLTDNLDLGTSDLNLIDIWTRTIGIWFILKALVSFSCMSLLSK